MDTSSTSPREKHAIALTLILASFISILFKLSNDQAKLSKQSITTDAAIRKILSNGYDVLEESQSTGSNHLDNMVIKAYKPYIHKLSYKPYIVLVQAPS